MSQELLVLITAPNADEAARLAETIVSERLAACVNVVGGVTSIYRWQGEVTRDNETLMIVKTTADRYDELERRIKELHSYTTPEVIALKIERGAADYLHWLSESGARDGE